MLKNHLTNHESTQFDHLGNHSNGGTTATTVQQGNLIVQKSTHLPNMPSEVRHTNYQRKPQLINPHILEHRDSANFSLASSSDSG